MEHFDVIIVGGGPAGLNAALVLGRCRHKVLLCDFGQYRNQVSLAMHGFLTRDGFSPTELRRIGREQLAPYGVAMMQTHITDAVRHGSHFELTTAKGEVFFGRKLLLATGISDNLPQVAGFDPLYGVSAFHCPYCDGWEQRDKRIVAYARGPEIIQFVMTLRAYTSDLILCTDGPSALSSADRDRLGRHDIVLIEKRVSRLESQERQLTHIVFEDGEKLERDVLFFHLGQKQRSFLAARLGVPESNEEGVQADETSATNIPGLFIAGDATRDVQQVIVAAAEGAKAAFEINMQLRDENYP